MEPAGRRGLPWPSASPAPPSGLGLCSSASPFLLVSLTLIDTQWVARTDNASRGISHTCATCKGHVGVVSLPIIYATTSLSLSCTPSPVVPSLWEPTSDPLLLRGNFRHPHE